MGLVVDPYSFIRQMGCFIFSFLDTVQEMNELIIKDQCDSW